MSIAPYENDGFSAYNSKRITLSVKSLSNAALAFVVFLGGFVFIEPAPYELLIIPLLALWFLCGLTFQKGFLPLTFFMLTFISGGFLAATQRAEIGDGIFYITVTAFLATTAIFFAAIIAERPLERLNVVFKAYILAAIIGSLIAILTYFRLVPNSESFLFGGRAKGPFQDPNVFGPFLVLPALYLFRKILTEPLMKNVSSMMGLLLIMAAIFLAFSRAAWGFTFIALVMMTAVVFIGSQSSFLRGRIILLSILMVFGAVGLLLFALSFDAVSSLFDQRAQLVQSYDSARFGRFARYSYGADWIMQAPLGYGFGKFRETFGEDTHNVYIKAFMVYGWLGGLSYLILLITTLIVGFKQIFLKTPWQAYFQCCYIAVFGHAIVGMVVDTDRWRHLYLIYGLLWGMIAAQALWKRRKAFSY